MQNALLENMSTVGARSLENVTFHDLDRLPALQREKLYMLFREKRIADRNDPRYLQEIWDTDPRWKGIERRHTAEDIMRLRGNIYTEYTRSKNGSREFWENCTFDPQPQRALGCYTGHQAVQTVMAGHPVVYVGGWNVAADGNNEDTLTDQSIYEPKEVPEHVYKMNNALEKMQKIHWFNGTKKGKIWVVPLVADMEAGHGGELNVDMETKWNIEAGAAAVHIEDQISSKKKCGHLDGKLLRSTEESIVMVQQIRQQADVMDVPLFIIVRTDAVSAGWIMTDIDERDRKFIVPGERSPEGYYRYRGGLEAAIARGLAYCPHADMIWFESKSPDLEEARMFAESIHAVYPGKLLAYNCSGNFNWKAHFMSRALARYGMPLSVKEIAEMRYKKVATLVAAQLPDIAYERIEEEVEEEMAAFQGELGKLGYKFLFVTTAGFWSNNVSMGEVALDHMENGMAGFSRLQERGFDLRESGFDAATPQTFVGVKLADFKVQCANAGKSSTTAFKGSTEAEQFSSQKPA